MFGAHQHPLESVITVASVVSDSVRPQRRQPTRLPHPCNSPSKNTGMGCHFLLQCMKVKSESEVAQSCLTLATPWTTAYQAPLSMGFSRQKYWSGVPLPSLSGTLGGRKWESIPVFLPGEFQGQRSLVGYNQRVRHD